jgi:protein TonB
VRRSVLVGSIAVHAALAALLYGLPRRAPAPAARRRIEIEVVRPASEPERTVPTAPLRSPPAPSGGAAHEPAPAAAPRLVAAPRLAPAVSGRLAITGYDRGTVAGDRAAQVGVGVGVGVGGRGAGAGLGLGDGTGSGLGDLASLPAPPPAPPPPPPPPAAKPPSRARPPRLIYPARDRPSDDAETFVARLTVDPDGYVVGARLVRGLGGSRDELAAQLVWRFRYAPALDDDGRAIRATIDQRFLVGY